MSRATQPGQDGTGTSHPSGGTAAARPLNAAATVLKRSATGLMARC
jgi:hypothetical protein